MANIQELLARAAALRDETALNSISPERAGGIMYDTIMAINELWLQQGSALVISKIYTSVASMEADDEPVSDISGQPLRAGQIVVIASSDSDNGSVYRFGGISEGASVWALVGTIGGVPCVDSLDSDSTTLPLAAHQGKVLNGKISQLGQEVYDELHTKNYDNIPLENNFSGYIASNGNIEASDSFKVMYVSCAVGDEYKLRFERYTANSARCWAIYSTDDIAEVGPSNLLAIGPVGEAGVDYAFKVEDSNAKLLLIQNNISTASPYNPTLTKVRYSKKFEDLATEMIASRDWSISGNVIYDSNEIPQSYNVTWSDGITGTVVMSNFNFNVFEYTTITATYKTMTIIYTLTFDSNGYITNETYNIE